MPENAPDFAKVIAKAWRDPAFKAELIANPAAALKAEGIDVPDGMAVTVVENTDKQFHLVLPPVPTDELSDEALDAVAGGYCRLSHLGGYSREAIIDMAQPELSLTRPYTYNR
jgi:hypothetical protein